MKANAIHRLQAVLGLLYLIVGVAKLAGAGIMVEAFEVIGLGQSLRVVVGMVEIIGGICLFIPRASIYAGLLLACTVVAMVGATLGHVARLGADRPSFDTPQFTVSKTYEASLQRSARLSLRAA